MKKLIFFLTFLFSLITVANAAEGDYIVKFRNDAPMLMSYGRDIEFIGADMYLMPEEQALALKDAGFLDICQSDRKYGLCEAADDASYSKQWNLPIIRADYAWSFKSCGNNVLVGIIDSGLDSDHPDIDYSRVVEGYNFAAFKEDADYETELYNTEDTIGHGTRVAGIIAAKRNNGIGLAGIADKVNIIPLKCTRSNGDIYESSVINAIVAGAGYFGCDVLNLSIAADTPSTALSNAINYARGLGCIIVCCAGNNNEEHPGNHIRYPAGCDGVISVGSTTLTNTRAETSVANESVFICAPADSIPLVSIGGEYVYRFGTSYASPQVAAAAAIAKSIDPFITPDEFELILKNTAVHPRNSGGLLSPDEIRDDDFGYGILNIENMINYMLSGKSVYVSPIDDETNSVTLFNLTSSEISASSIFGAYKGNEMPDYSHLPFTLAANGSVTHTFTTTSPYGKLRHFMWKSLQSVTPYDSSYIPRELIK